MRTALVLSALTVVFVTSCSGAQQSTGDPLKDADPGLAHVHGLGVDPADGMLYAATHYGVFRVPESGQPARIADRYQDTMGFAVVGPGHFLGSGHPDMREDLPTRLGLIESKDAAKTWTVLSLGGEADFHALEAAHGLIYGYDAGSGKLLVSKDGRTWVTRTELGLLDFAVSPTDADMMVATTGDGVTRSTTGGRSFEPVDGAPPIAYVAWPAADTIFGLTTAGEVVTSSDGGTTWQQRGQLEGRPEALTAVGGSTVFAATKHGIFASTDGGRTFIARYPHN